MRHQKMGSLQTNPLFINKANRHSSIFFISCGYSEVFAKKSFKLQFQNLIHSSTGSTSATNQTGSSPEGNTTNPRDIESEEFKTKYFKGQWSVEGLIVHFRKISRKMVFFDLQINGWKHPVGFPFTIEVKDSNATSYLSLQKQHSAIYVANHHGNPPGFNITMDAQNPNSVKIEVLLKFPLCYEVKALSSKVRLGDTVRVKCEYAEQLCEENRKHILFHASSIETVKECTVSPDSVVQRPLSLRKANAQQDTKKNKECKIISKNENDSEEGQANNDDDDDEMPCVDNVCKYWINSKSCVNGDSCVFLHPQGNIFMEVRRAWISKRIQRRRFDLKQEEDPLDPHNKRSKCARAKIFSDWLIETFSKDFLSSGAGVVDIAGGRGSLSFSLHVIHGVETTLVDPRDQKLSRFEHKYFRTVDRTLPRSLQMRFDHNDKNLDGILDGASCLVGLHPDEATESIVRAAVARKMNFAVVPCCVFPKLFPERTICVDGILKSVESYEDFVRYLRQLCEDHGGVSEIGWLNFEGKNCVIFCRSYST